MENEKLHENESTIAEKALPADVNKVLESLDPEKREIIMGAMYAMEQTSYSGPLPAPEDFLEYKKVLPSAPERILKMAEKQQEHRIQMEKDIVAHGMKESTRGQILGVMLVLACLVAAVYLGINGHDWLAGCIIAIVASIATIFVLKRKPDEKKEEDK